MPPAPAAAPLQPDGHQGESSSSKLETLPRESNEDGEGKETGEAAQVAAQADSDGLGNVPGHADSVDDDRPTVSNGGTITSGRVDGAGLVNPEKALTNGEEAERDAGAAVHPGNRGDELGDVAAGPGTDKELRARGAESGGEQAEGVGNGVVKSAGPSAAQVEGPAPPDSHSGPAEKTGPELGAFDQKNPATNAESLSNGQKPPSNTPTSGPVVNAGPIAQKSAGPSAAQSEGPAPLDSVAESVDNEVYRIELEFVQRTTGTHIKLRLRSRFSVDNHRPSLVLGVFKCGNLTDSQIKKARMKTLPPKVRAALSEGDLDYELIKQLLGRPGKGRNAQSRAAAQTWVGSNADLDSNESSGERGQARTGDDHANGDILDGGVFAPDEPVRSDRIQ